MRKTANTSIKTGPDLISSLPDIILHHILGFLKTREAVQTCVLSKRWKHLWASVCSLHFDSNDFIQRNRLNELQGEEREIDFLTCYERERFVKFVTTVLRRREPLNFDRFLLCCSKLIRGHHKRTRDWIRYAVKHHPRVLHLLGFYSLPSCIFTCTSLEELHLSSCQMHVSGPVNLPKLKKLVMYFCYDEDIRFPHNFLSGCLYLEYLELRRFGLVECKIAHACLKHVCFIDCYIRRLLIDAPNLLSLSYRSDSAYHIYPPPPHETILNMPSLEFACMHTSCFRISEHLEAVLSMLRALSNAELLHLFAYHCELEELHGIQLPELPIFHKLKKVTVAFCEHACFEVVAWILNCSPNLKKLTLMEQSCCRDKMGATMRESTDVSLMAAITSCKELEIIEVKYQKKCDQMVGQLVSALIDGTKEFENLDIHLSKYKSC